jgi:hypothetical protein
MKSTNPLLAHCTTCGSEIVATVNDGAFRYGECGGCEYQRYTTQPKLLEAAKEALTILYETVSDLEDDKGEANCVRLLTAAIAAAEPLTTA